LLDRDQIIDIAFLGIPDKRPVPFPSYPSLMAYEETIGDLLEQYPTNAYDPEKAAEHLTKAGYTKNDEGMWVDADGNTLKVVIDGWPYMSAYGEVAVEQLRRGGIDAEWTLPPDAWDRFIQYTYTAFPAGLTGSLKDPYNGLNQFTCGKTGGPAGNWNSNNARWCNPEYDEIVLQMAQTDPADFDAMQPLYRQAMEIWLRELPSPPMFDWMHHFAMNETYWTNWPTVDNEKDGQYVNEASQLISFLMVLTHLEPAQ
jgi:peptide/nickel transport system substrate-binding protein